MQSRQLFSLIDFYRSRNITVFLVLCHLPSVQNLINTLSTQMASRRASKPNPSNCMAIVAKPSTTDLSVNELHPLPVSQETRPLHSIGRSSLKSFLRSSSASRSPNLSPKARRRSCIVPTLESPNPPYFKEFVFLSIHDAVLAAKHHQNVSNSNDSVIC
ncbi:unnamed protein product [Protopolystoma xenopodis]|uniref:Uncharacterized protein n=1 Tax=Protopolystoma xenopodis TaxID=117903 RepID=A0A3S5CI45_9PLAT|nr:unnamed protein product [Protopolystoma xenopodis]